jgi:hypothetical protein
VQSGDLDLKSSIYPNLNEYKLTAIVLDIAGHKLFTCVGIKKDERDKPSFQKLSFANKGLDGINLGNYQWGTCTGAIRRLRFEIVNIEIMQHVFVIK